MPKLTSKKQKLKKQLRNDPFVWIIAYIDSKFLSSVEKQLNKYPEYKDVSVYIPTVKILKKTFKKENHFEEVPLLFNYGFFKVPRIYAVYKDWLDNLQRNISCIYGWVKDSANIIENKPRLRVDGKSALPLKNVISIATASSVDIARLIKETANMGAHSADDISLLSVGSPIVLRGYPFEGVNATVIDIDHKKQKVNVSIQIFDQMKEVKVSFDNVFFTIYHSNKNYDDSLSSDASIEDLGDKKVFDKIQKKNWKDDTK